MSGATPAVFISGIPLATHGPYAINSITDRTEGPYAAELAVHWRTNVQPPEITTGALVDITVAGGARWAGSVLDYDRNAGTISCEGVAREPESAPALTSAGETTSNPREAVTTAVANGWMTWSNVDALPTDNVVSGGVTDGLNKVSALILAWASEHQVTIGVDAGRRVRITANTPATQPDWLILPQAGVLGVTEEAIARTMVGRWDDGTNLHTAIAGTGRPVETADLTPFGAIDSTRAGNLLAGMLANLGALNGWTNGITITRSQILTPGGIHPHLSRPRAGDTARILGQRDVHGRKVAVDVVIGESIWSPEGFDGGTLTLNPANLAPRDLATVIEAAGGAAA